jgi:hypothetical protein
MNTNEQTASAEAIPRISLVTVVHELANTLVPYAARFSFSKEILNKKPIPRRSSALITTLKEECSRMESHLQQMRRLARESQP